jgi:hypothetical protein
LSILSSEQVKLRTLPTQIRAKLSDLQTKSKLVYEALEKKEAMLPTVVMSLDRMKFCNAESALLWKTGSDLLMAVFIATLEHKKTNKKWKFPSDLSNAINQTAEMDSAWTHLPLNRLLTSPFPYFTIGFVANVWGTYTQNLTNIEDVGALMRYCIHALPQTGFQKITKAKDKSKALEQEFYRLIREDVTFVTLKEWAQKQKRLVEETA